MQKWTTDETFPWEKNRYTGNESSAIDEATKRLEAARPQQTREDVMRRSGTLLPTRQEVMDAYRKAAEEEDRVQMATPDQQIEEPTVQPTLPMQRKRGFGAWLKSLFLPEEHTSATRDDSDCGGDLYDYLPEDERPYRWSPSTDDAPPMPYGLSEYGWTGSDFSELRMYAESGKGIIDTSSNVYLEAVAAQAAADREWRQRNQPETEESQVD